MERTDIEHLARLARLQLSEREYQEFAEDLTKILGYVSQLNEVDVTDVKPTSQVTGLENVLREDLPDDARSVTREQIERMAPAFEDGYVKVPSVFSTGDE